MALFSGLRKKDTTTPTAPDLSFKGENYEEPVKYSTSPQGVTTKIASPGMPSIAPSPGMGSMAAAKQAAFNQANAPKVAPGLSRAPGLINRPAPKMPSIAPQKAILKPAPKVAPKLPPKQITQRPTEVNTRQQEEMQRLRQQQIQQEIQQQTANRPATQPMRDFVPLGGIDYQRTPEFGGGPAFGGGGMGVQRRPMPGDFTGGLVNLAGGAMNPTFNKMRPPPQQMQYFNEPGLYEENRLPSIAPQFGGNMGQFGDEDIAQRRMETMRNRGMY